MKRITPVFPGALRADLQQIHRLSVNWGKPEFLSFHNPYTRFDFIHYIRSVLDPIHHGTTLVIDPLEKFPIDGVARRELKKQCPEYTQNFQFDPIGVPFGVSFAKELFNSPVNSLIIINPEGMQLNWPWFLSLATHIGDHRGGDTPSMIFIGDHGPSTALRGKLSPLRGEPSCLVKTHCALSKSESLEFFRLNLALLEGVPEYISLDPDRMMRGIKIFPVPIGKLKRLMSQKSASLERHVNIKRNKIIPISHDIEMPRETTLSQYGPLFE